MTSSVTIRPATANDQTEIRTAVMRNNLNLLGLSWQSFSVAVDTDGHFVGCGQIKSHADIEELASLVVADAWQGQGVSNLLIEVLLDRADRALWLMCESPLVGYYNKFDFAEIKDPQKLPPLSFRGVHWMTGFPLGFMFFMRGTYIAFMVLTRNKRTGVKPARRSLQPLHR